MKISMDLYLALTNFDIKNFPYLMPELFNVLKFSSKQRLLEDLKSGRVEVDERLTVLVTALYLHNDDRVDYIYENKDVLIELLNELDFDNYYSSFMEVRNTLLTFATKESSFSTSNRRVPAAYELANPITPIQKEVKAKSIAVYTELPDIGILSGITFIKHLGSDEETQFKGSCPISLYPKYQFEYTKKGLILTEENIQVLNLNLAQKIKEITKEDLVSVREDFLTSTTGILSNAVNLIREEFTDSLLSRSFSK